MNNESAYVAFLDIMGFSELIERNSQEKLVKIYKTILNKVYSFLPTLTDREERDTVTVNSFIIQDSIILWIKGFGFPNFVLLLGTVQILLNFGFKEGFPIRGGISQGKISILNEDHENYSVRSILGPPLVKAYYIEREQNWMGCVCEESVIVDNKIILEDPVFRSMIVKYQIPLKKGPIKEGYAVVWHDDVIKQNAEKIVREKFSANKKDTNTWEVEQKIINTIKFVKNVEPHTGLLRAIKA